MTFCVCLHWLDGFCCLRSGSSSQGKFCAWSCSKYLPLSHLISTKEQQESLYSMASSKSETSISGDLLEKAKKELNEDPQTRRVEVKNLAKRLEKVPGLHPRLDHPFLLKFLRARKFDQERAFELVKNYYEVRQSQKDMFDDLKPSRVKHMLDAGVLEVLQGRDANGCAVVVIRPARWDPERFPILDLPKTLFLVLNHLSENEEIQVNGVHIINNMDGLTMTHASHITPTIAKRITGVIQNVVPMRLKKLDYVNEPSFFNLIFGIVKQFLKEKLLKRISMYGPDVEKLQATISPDILPKDLGGKLEPHSHKAWMEEVLASEQAFVEDNKFGYVNMDVKSDKSKNSKAADADMQGLGGTFKKLDI